MHVKRQLEYDRRPYSADSSVAVRQQKSNLIQKIIGFILAARKRKIDSLCRSVQLLQDRASTKVIPS